MKNLNFVMEQLKKGGYIAEYQNYQGSGLAGALAGTALQDKDGRCLLSNVQKEFIHLKANGQLKPVKWKEGVYSGTEWYLK